MSQTYILLPVHNRLDKTKEFVRCLAQQNVVHYRLIVLDDGSTDGTGQWLDQQTPKPIVIRGCGTWWWAGALQVGLKRVEQLAQADDFILIANNDTSFEPDFLAAGIRELSSTEKGLLLAQCYSGQSGTLIDYGIHADWKKLRFMPAENPRAINCLSTRGLLFRVRDLAVIGGFRPWLLPHYGADYEFTMRAARKGYVLMSRPSFRLVLDEETTGLHQFRSNGILEFLKLYFSNRSPRNPVDWTVLVLLACPWRFKFFNLARIWRRVFKEYFNQKRLAKFGGDPR